MKKSQFFYRMSLVVFSLASLILLGLPTSQALVIVPAPNNRCGPKAGGGACTAVGALDVPQAVTPGTQVRQCYEFDTSATTAGPLNVDVVGGFPNDVWFRFPGPHCPGKRIVINTSGSTYTASSFLLTQGGGSVPFYLCDVTCTSVAGNAYFASDVVVNSASGNYNITIPASLAARNFFTLVNGGGSGVLRYCVTTACP